MMMMMMMMIINIIIIFLINIIIIIIITITVGGRTSPPSSGFSIRNSTIDTATLVMTVIVLCVGYAALIAALVFNLIWRNNKYI